MKPHFSNAFYGVLDYASYPIGMLLVAPIVLHKLGAAEYGLWILLYQHGLRGLAIARACYGATALLVYLPLLLKFGPGIRRNVSSQAIAPPYHHQEGTES